MAAKQRTDLPLSAAAMIVAALFALLGATPDAAPSGAPRLSGFGLSLTMAQGGLGAHVKLPGMVAEHGAKRGEPAR